MGDRFLVIDLMYSFCSVTAQGDESSDEDLFGMHTIAVHGGHFRIEHAEVRRCGQASNLGRYCLHLHKTGYNAPPNTYIKSNSIHHSYQRATTIHGTQHALVENNVASGTFSSIFRPFSPRVLCHEVVLFSGVFVLPYAQRDMLKLAGTLNTVCEIIALQVPRHGAQLLH